MTDPIITIAGNAFIFTWEEDALTIRVSRIREHRDSRVTAEIYITTTNAKYSPLLHQSVINLTSDIARKKLAKSLADDFPEWDWGTLLFLVSNRALHKYRAGEPLVWLRTDEKAEPPEYLIYPFLPMNQPTIIFGEGASGKSEIALLFALVVQHRELLESLDLHTHARTGGYSLLLDWETEEKDVLWKLKCLQEGSGIPLVELAYRRCALPLVDDLEAVQKAITEQEIKLVIIDSLGPAAGGDLKDANVAMSFFSALRQLKTTCLIIAHTSKDANQQKKSVYGSVFFENISRSVWEIRKAERFEPEVNVNHLAVCLYHTKYNTSAKQKERAFQFNFNSHKTTVEYVEDPTIYKEFVAGMDAKVRILDFLRENDLTEPKDLMLSLNLTRSNVDTACSRLRDEGKISKYGKCWGLAER